MIFMTIAMCWMAFLHNAKHGNSSAPAPFSAFSIANVFASATLWPSIPYVVPEKMLGIAYGLMLSLLNMCVTFGPIFVGLIHDNTMGTDHGYFWSIAFIIFWLTLGIADCIMLIKYDKENGYKLFTPEYITKAYF